MVANAIKGVVFLIMIFCSLQSAKAQTQEGMDLHDALLEIALAEELSLIYNPSDIPNIQIGTLDTSRPLSVTMKNLLKGTSLEYRVKDEQIFLYIRKRIFGYIEDGDTGERLIAATFSIPSEEVYDVANAHGFFSIETIQDSVAIEASYVGYENTKIVIDRDEMNKPIVIKLYSDNSIDEVVISDALLSKEERDYIELDQGSDILLYQNQATSAVGGEPDIFQSIIRQTGVNAGTDGLGGIHVRGGRNDQNMVLVDGVRLYSSSHAFGLFSIVNNSIIDQAKLYKSGSSGALSGRLSSILDITTKDPTLDKFTSQVQVSTLASQATVQGPIVKDKLGISITGRRTHLDPILKIVSDKSDTDGFESGNLNYWFSDFHLKAYGKLYNKSRLYLTLYQSADQYNGQEVFITEDFAGPLYTYNDKTDYKWKNQIAALRYNTLLGGNSFINVTLSQYRYKYNNELEFNETDFFDPDFPLYYREYSTFSSSIQTTDLKLQGETVTDRHEIQWGVTLQQKEFTTGDLLFEQPEFTEVEPIPSGIPLDELSSGTYISNEATVHLSDKFRASRSLIFDGGAYLTYWDSKDISFDDSVHDGILTHGYLRALYRYNKKFAIGGVAGKYVQTDHLLSVGDNGYPNDIWLPSTDFTPPEEARQYEVFSNLDWKNSKLNLSVYYKTQDGLVWYDTIPALPTLSDLVTLAWEEETSLGTSESYGFEVDYTYSIPNKITLRSAYTYGQTNHTFPFINEGEPFPYDFSISHTVSLGLNARLHKRWQLSMDWFYASGRPFTSYAYSPSVRDDGAFSPLDRDTEFNLIEEGDINAGRLPDVHKLSLSLSTYWLWSGVRNDFSLGVQNLYNRNNELYRYGVLNLETDEIEIRKQNGFPILPMLRWRVSM